MQNDSINIFDIFCSLVIIRMLENVFCVMLWVSRSRFL